MVIRQNKDNFFWRLVMCWEENYERHIPRLWFYRSIHIAIAAAMVAALGLFCARIK